MTVSDLPAVWLAFAGTATLHDSCRSFSPAHLRDALEAAQNIACARTWYNNRSICVYVLNTAHALCPERSKHSHHLVPAQPKHGNC